MNYSIVKMVIYLIFFAGLVNTVFSQRIGILTPDKSLNSSTIAEKLKRGLSPIFEILDSSLCSAAFAAIDPETPFNLTVTDSKRIGAAIGSDFFFLVESKTLKRFPLSRKEYFESYAVVFVVSSRTGRLVHWKLLSQDSPESNKSEKMLFESVSDSIKEISDKIENASKSEIAKVNVGAFPELPAENTPEAKNLRPPLPFKRIRPQYTDIANLYGIEATVDILVDIDADGKVLHSEIERWAGFELDESVTSTVSEMNWRPADRDGETLPTRVLLRYNFKKIEQ